MRGYHSNTLALDTKQEHSLLFNYFSTFRMQNPQKLVSWAVASSMADYARGIEDVSLTALSYHGSHVSASTVKQYITKWRSYIHETRATLFRSQSVISFGMDNSQLSTIIKYQKVMENQ